MTFEAFVEAIMVRFPYVSDLARVRNDRENGRYLAKLPDGKRIIARPGSRFATMREGSHQYMFEL